jgi:integrase
VDNDLVVLRAFLIWSVALRKVRTHTVHEDSPGAKVFFNHLKNACVSIRTKTTHDGLTWSPKDDTDRKVPIHPDLRRILTDLRGDSKEPGYVFPGPTGPHRSDRFERIKLKRLKPLARATDVPKDTLTFHNFRRYFVSQCADCGIDMACVMNWVGHDDLEMVL